MIENEKEDKPEKISSSREPFAVVTGAARENAVTDNEYWNYCDNC